MILLGILLLGATGAFTGLLIAYNLSGGPDYTVTMFGNDLVTMNTLAVFLSGIALALIFCAGCALALGGGARMRRRMAELGEARAQARQATADRDALQDRTVGTAPPTAQPGAPTPPAHRHRHLFGH